MLISQAFPSEFLKAADLQDQPVRVIMGHTEPRDIGDETKPALHFQKAQFDWFPKDENGKCKPMILNKTNSNNIALVYGDETDDWVGKELILYPTMVDFQGRSVAAIRVRGPKPKTSQREVRTNGAPPRPSIRTELNDEVPF